MSLAASHTVANAPTPPANTAHSVTALLISAVASGQGKTTVTAALARKLRNTGQRVRVFKTGPDFLDPMILAQACGHPVDNLDLWLVGRAACQQRLAEAAQHCDVILIEGVMGLYDGAPSSADLANDFGLPVLAVLDAGAMAQTAGALALGLRDYGPVQLAGVIANRIASPGHAEMVAKAMRDIPLIATLSRQAEALPERHLGLVQAAEIHDLDARLDALAETLQWDTQAWASLPRTTFAAPPSASPLSTANLQGKTIAVAKDAAFAFAYPANLACLEALGAQLVYFSPLADEAIPPQAEALWLPGGYPELHGTTLAQAQNWLTSLRAAHAQGMPILAECGGMMALAEQLSDKAGATWPMAGLLQGQMRMQTRLAALGSQALDTAFGELRGHAFHYSVFDTALPIAQRSRKHPASATAGEAVYRVGALTATYFHAYFPSCPAAVAAVFTGQAWGQAA